VSFRNALVIMTSNLGSEAVLELSDRDSRELDAIVQGALRAHFRPEFLNRLDEIVIFDALSREHIGHIVELQFAHLRTMLAERRIGLLLTPAARNRLADEGYDPHFGARPLKRTIQRRVQNPLAMKLLKGEFAPGETIEVDAQGGDFSFRSLQPLAVGAASGTGGAGGS
jgi:ATP-dependent Clp protease ATP-binding subunit ClpB